jgi:hypothetical protein
MCSRLPTSPCIYTVQALVKVLVLVLVLVPLMVMVMVMVMVMLLGRWLPSTGSCSQSTEPCSQLTSCRTESPLR